MQQSPIVRYSDLQLSIPILLYPIEPISERGRKFLTMLSSEFYFDVENDLAKLLEEINFDVPKTIRAKIYIINDQADYLILRKRLTNETSLLFLRCFTAMAFVDYSANKNIDGARAIVRSLFRADRDSSSLVIYQASESIADEYSDNTYLLFAAHTDETALANVQNHLNNTIYKSVRSNVPHASKHETKKQFFMFLSGEKEEQFRAFQHTLTKKGKFEIKAIVLEMMGLFETYHEGEIREKKITNLLSSEKLWEYDITSTSFSNLSINSPSSNASGSITGTNPSILTSSGAINSNPNVNSTDNTGANVPPNLPVPPTSLASSYEDLWLYYSQAAYYYSKAQNNLKVFDCAYRLLATFDNIQLIDEAINYLLRSIEDPKIKNTSIDTQEKVSLRAWEMLSLLLSKNYQRKVPLFSFLISEKMTGNAKIDFQLQTLNFLYRQKPGDYVIRDVCYPIVSQLLSSNSCLNALSKCKLALEFLSIAGPILPLDDQDQIFHQIQDDSIGDIRIPCNLGFKTSNVKFIDRTYEVRILDSDDSSKNSKANSLFKYTFLNNSQENKNSCIVSVGSHVSFSLDIFNPFSIALPVLICAHENDNYDSKEYPHVLQAKTFTTVHCYVIPKQNNTEDQSDSITDTKITSIDIILAEGVEEVKLSDELSLTIVPNVPKFVLRTSLPIHQPMTLYDGELLNVKLWLTNNASIPIDELVIKSGNTVKGENDLNLCQPIQPYMSANTEFDLTIDRNMTKIDLNVTARTKSCTKAESFSKLIQPVKIEPAISISSIQLLKSIPEIDIDMSNLIFIAIDIKNSSNSVFNYKAHFKAAAELGFDFPGIITKKETSGVLTEFETTVFILAVEKDQILSDKIEVENSRFINARRDEEERINQKLTSEQRKVLNDRVKVTAFIENNLVFRWFCRIGRSGLLPANTALPSLDVMHEISMKRPKLIHSFDSNPLRTNKRVNLNLQFVGAKIARCALRLGMLQDPEYGIVWEGTLLRTIEQAERKEDGDVYSFQLFFTKPGHFNFKVYYESEEKVKGHTRIDFDVEKNDNDDNEYQSDDE